MNTFAAYRLDGKTALITGAAGLLGIEHAAALLESGARLVLTDINESGLQRVRETLMQAYGAGQMMIYPVDVTDPQKITALADAITADNMHVDILINNAAIDPKVTGHGSSVEMSRLENFSLEQWDVECAVGLKGAFLCSKIFGTKMAAKGSGVILNIASDLSVISPDQRLYRKEGLLETEQPVKPVTYSVIKAGLVGLTRYLATYWADKGVRANALSPGGVFNNQDAAFVERLSELIPAGRMANKDEYRGAIQFLCSDASSYLNGQNIVMDGGRSVW